ncbi:MAG: hypothetical protein WCK34_15435 [Bacteroidota bacterium]
MSKTTSNELRKSYSGIFGNQVLLKNRNGKSVMSILPARPGKGSNVNQLKVREQFKEAVEYAVAMQKNPSLLAEYSEKATGGLTPFTLAVRDYLTPPVVKRIDTSDYHGNPGEVITVKATDDFKVRQVKIQFISAEGNMFEEGICEYMLPECVFRYTTTFAGRAPAGMTIKAIATDTPGNKAELSVTL